MNQSKLQTQKAPPPAGLLGRVLRMRGLFRLLLIPYFVLIGVGVFLGIFVNMYGEAHSGALNAAKFLFTPMGVGAVVAAPLLILLIPSRSRVMLAIQGLAMLGMAAVILFVLATAYDAIYEPESRRSKANFEALVESVRT